MDTLSIYKKLRAYVLIIDMKQLDENLLLSLGFMKDGSLNISPDFYLKKKKVYMTVNLKGTSDKQCGITVVKNINKDINFYIKLESRLRHTTIPLYLEQLNIINCFLLYSGLPISDEILKRNGYKEGQYKNDKIVCTILNSVSVFANNNEYKVNLDSPIIYCSYLDLIYKLLGEKNKRIW